MRGPLVSGKKCVFYEHSLLSHKVDEKVICQEDASGHDIRRIEVVDDVCFDRQGMPCSVCWRANVSGWTVIETERKTRQFIMGGNIIDPSNATFKHPMIYEGREYEKEGKRLREIVEYIDTESEILALGYAKRGFMDSGRPFIISKRDYESTVGAGHSDDADNAWKLMVGLGFICIFAGLLIILALIDAPIDAFGAISHLVDSLIGLSRIRGRYIWAFSLAWSVLLGLMLFALARFFSGYSQNLGEGIFAASLAGYVSLIAAGRLAQTRGLGSEPVAKRKKPLDKKVSKDKETVHNALQKKGFDFEKMHMEAVGRIKKDESGLDEFAIERSPQRLGERPRPAGDSIAILYIEYDSKSETSAHLINEYLKKRGYHVDLANSAEEGLEKVAKAGYDIVICDNETDEMGQDIICAAIKRMDPKQKVIMYSSRAELLTHQQMGAISADAYIAKKDFETLIKSISELCRK